MRPAFSVVLLTTLIGAGQGLFLALYTGQVYALANLLPAQGTAFYANGSLIALALLVVGLAASFFHLGRPERAWRAAARWRTSWLSREVLALPLVMALVAAYGLAHGLGWTAPLFTLSGTLPVTPSLLIGLVGTVAVFVLFLCTAMIYASVKFLQEWYTPLTVVNFTLLGIASGFLLAAGYSAWLGNRLVSFYGILGLVATLMAFVARLAALARNRALREGRGRKTTIQTAIGVRHATVVQKAQGATGGSFNTREFFHGRSDATLRGVRHLFLTLVFILPVGLVALGYGLESATLPMTAFAVQFVGLLAERWYFFAEARHPQNLYYQGLS
jgi:DMSO reductase anchor subunit